MNDFNSNCGSFYTVPSGTTVANSDLHIYVDGYNDSSASGAVASGIPCIFVAGALPDITNSVGRPIAGLIRINVYDFSSVTSYPTSLYASTIGTIVHEIAHVLGFGSNYFSSYLDSGTNNLHTSATDTVTNTRNSQSVNNDILKTPNVLAWAKAHYNCNSMTGMQL